MVQRLSGVREEPEDDVYTVGMSQRVDIWVDTPPNHTMAGIFQDVIERLPGGVTVLLSEDSAIRRSLVFEMNVDASQAAGDWIERVNERIKEMGKNPLLLDALLTPPPSVEDVMATGSAGTMSHWRNET